MDNRFEALQVGVLYWADQKGITAPENAPKQFLKVIEEVGELAAAMVRNDKHEQVDAMGDTLVTLIILAEQLGLDPVHCLNTAYQVIKDRTGKTVDGVFIKDDGSQPDYTR
jgi:NTP pyrophosphatase (non-canonical NTP hydrolase)